MSKEITKDNPIIILVVATSFGEIDWILPVLKVLMKKNNDWRLVTVFGHKLVHDRFKKTNPILFNEFIKISSLNIVPQELDLLFSKQIEPQKVKIILKDYNNDEYASYKTDIADQCPEALVVSFPHSCHIYSRMGKDPMSVCDNPEAYSKHDIFLLGSENDIPHWSKYVDVQKIRALGTPRYDSWWLNTFLNDPKLESTQEFKCSQKADKVFFYISRGVHPHYLSQPDYDYIVKSIADTVFSQENSLLLIKPHPRQDINELFKLLAPYDKQRCIVSGLHLFQLINMSDVVISGWSSGILDTLAIEKPVIEFWRFGGQDPICRKTEDGDYTTIYRELGLAAAADTKEELEVLLENALESPETPIWKSQIAAFKKYCKFTDEAANDIAKLFETEIEQRANPNGAVDIENRETIQSDVDDVINKMIEYIESILENGEVEKARHWFEFMNEQFSEDVRVLNNFGIFLFNQGDVSSAVDRMTECLTLHPSYNEAAVNLIQILLIVKRTEDALNIVVSHYSQAVDEGMKRRFLQSLAEQLSPEQFIVVQQKVEQMHQ